MYSDQQDSLKQAIVLQHRCRPFPSVTQDLAAKSRRPNGIVQDLGIPHLTIEMGGPRLLVIRKWAGRRGRAADALKDGQELRIGVEEVVGGLFLEP
jgi:hypothetical protein